MDTATGSRPVWYRRAWTVVSLLILAVLVEYVVLPKLTLARESFHRLETLNPGWVILAVGLEACSLVCYSLFTRALLRTSRIKFLWILRCDLTGYGASHVLPGGAATATAIRFRLLLDGGAKPTDVTATVTAEGIGSPLALVLIAWLTTIPALLLREATPAYLTMFLVGLFLIAAGILADRERSRVERSSARLLRWTLKRLPERVRPAIKTFALRMRDLLRDREVRTAFFVWATLNWLFDASVLWLFLAAYGERTHPVPVLLAYCAANLAGVVPLTPGGLGVIEGVAVSTLVGFGVSGQVALLAVLSWRLLQFWAPVPVAGLCFLSLRAQRSLSLRREARKSASSASTPPTRPSNR